MDYVVLVENKVKLKGEKRDYYLDLARELKELWNMKMTVMPIVVGALETIPKRLVKWLKDLEIRGQTTALLRSARILRKVLGTSGDLQSLKLQWKNIC